MSTDNNTSNMIDVEAAKRMFADMAETFSLFIDPGMTAAAALEAFAQAIRDGAIGRGKNEPRTNKH